VQLERAVEVDMLLRGAGAVFAVGTPHDPRDAELREEARIVCSMLTGDLRSAGLPLRPHDFSRYAATYASRAGVPIETVGKLILRHSNLPTTQGHLGNITDTEAMKWIEYLYG
jgi:integrase